MGSAAADTLSKKNPVVHCKIFCDSSYGMVYEQIRQGAVRKEQRMKKIQHQLAVISICMISVLAGCGSLASKEEKTSAEENSLETEEMSIWMRIDDEPVTVVWEDNESVLALAELLREQPLSIQMSMYGDFEQVGSFGTSLPREDEQTTTQAGDIVLYSGNQIVVFYGSNFWAYTRLGKITDKSADELKDLLGSGDVTITLELR